MSVPTKCSGTGDKPGRAAYEDSSASGLELRIRLLQVRLLQLAPLALAGLWHWQSSGTGTSWHLALGGRACSAATAWREAMAESCAEFVRTSRHKKKYMYIITYKTTLRVMRRLLGGGRAGTRRQTRKRLKMMGLRFCKILKRSMGCWLNGQDKFIHLRI